MAKYWQYETPLTCPNGHEMGWLGSLFWLCMKCPQIDKDGRAHKTRKGTIWVQTLSLSGDERGTP